MRAVQRRHSRRTSKGGTRQRQSATLTAASAPAWPPPSPQPLLAPPSPRAGAGREGSRLRTLRAEVTPGKRAGARQADTPARRQTPSPYRQMRRTRSRWRAMAVMHGTWGPPAVLYVVWCARERGEMAPPPLPPQSRLASTQGLPRSIHVCPFVKARCQPQGSIVWLAVCPDSQPSIQCTKSARPPRTRSVWRFS